MSVLYSCVMDTPAKFQHQALLWALTLVRRGDQPPENLVVHAVEGTPQAQIDLLRQFGVRVITVARYSAAFPFLNKLRQLETPALCEADHVVLCDTDLAFASPIGHWVTGSRPRIKIVDVANPPLALWRVLFAAAGFKRAPRPAMTSLDGEQTYANNCNGGLCILPRDLLRALLQRWPHWVDWTLGQGAILGRYRTHCFQISFALAMEEMGVEVDLLPLALNFPTNLPVPGLARHDVTPAVVHYHSQLDPAGRLKPIGLPLVDGVIGEINALIAAEAGTALMAAYRARVSAAGSLKATAMAQFGRAVRKFHRIASR